MYIKYTSRSVAKPTYTTARGSPRVKVAHTIITYQHRSLRCSLCWQVHWASRQAQGYKCPSSSIYVLKLLQRAQIDQLFIIYAARKKFANLFLPASGGVEDTSQLGSIHAELHTLYIIAIHIKVNMCTSGAANS